MIKLLKKTFYFIAALLVVICLLFLYMSTSSEDKDAYYQVIDYPTKLSGYDSTLNVMTYNIGYLSGMTNNRSILREKKRFDEHLFKAKKLIQNTNAAIVGLQEIDFGASRSFGVNQLDSLALSGDYVSAYKSINWDKKYVPFPYWPPSNHFGKMLSGQAILSHYPINGDSTIVLEPNTNAPAYYRAFYLDRLLQITDIDFLGTPVKVMNVHLEAYDKTARMRQTEQVKLVFEKYASKQPVILMGDFNSEVTDSSKEKGAIDILMGAEWIASAIPFDKESSNRTFSSEKPVRMIDYIFYNENFLRCTNAYVITEAGQISDHLPLFGQLTLR